MPSGRWKWPSPGPWRKTYRPFVPREMLSAGGNVLRIETARPLWSDRSVDRFTWWEWDYLAMKALALSAREPSYDDTHECAKIGVMVRESLVPGSAMAIMAISPGKGCG